MTRTVGGQVTIARSGWLTMALAGAAAVAAPGGALPAPLTALALAITWGVLPGAWLARRLASDQAADVRGAFALLASPFVCGGALALARTAGVQPTLAAQAISGVLALLAAGEALRPAAVETHAADVRPGMAFAIAIGAVLLLAYAFHPALTERSDGAFHAGVVRAVERGLPPEDPFFAGLPLRYAWGLHAWAAGWLALAPRLDAWTPLAWANAGAAVSALLAVSALARRLGATPRASVLAQALALVGAAPFGWLVLLARVSAGDVRGAAELRRALEHGADAAFRALDPGWLHPSLVLPLDKFVVLTPFAFALAGAGVTVLAVAAWHDTRRRRSLGGLTIALAAVLFVHPFSGGALLAALFAGGVTAAIVAGARRMLGGVVFAGAGAVLLTLPYLLALAGPVLERSAPPLPHPDLSRAGLFSVFIGGAIVLPMAMRALLGSVRRDAIAILVLTAGTALVLLASTIGFEGENQSKFLNLVFLVASAPAAVGWARLGPGLRRVAAIALALAVGPTLAAALWAYAHESATSDDAPPRPPAALLVALDRWVPRDGIVVDATQDTTRGAAPALPGTTGRSLLWSGGFKARKWGHARADLFARAELALGLERGEGTASRDTVHVEIGERELWLLAPEMPARAADPRERVVARADGVILMRVAN